MEQNSSKTWIKTKIKPKSQTRTLKTNLKKCQFLSKFLQKGIMGCEQNREKQQHFNKNLDLRKKAKKK